MLQKLSSPLKGTELQYYKALSFALMQLLGLHKSYSSYSHISLYDLYMINSDGQLSELEKLSHLSPTNYRFKQASSKHWIPQLLKEYQVKTPSALSEKLLLESRCSALIVYEKESDQIFFSHATFDHFYAMNRIFKRQPVHSRYNFAFDEKTFKRVETTFSSYPGTITSTDDFYIINSSLLVMETTLSVLVKSLLRINNGIFKEK